MGDRMCIRRSVGLVRATAPLLYDSCIRTGFRFRTPGDPLTFFWAYVGSRNRGFAFRFVVCRSGVACLCYSIRLGVGRL